MAFGRLIAKWKRLYLRAKPLEWQADEARFAVRDAIVKSGQPLVVSKLGTIPLQTRTTVDWEGMARAVIKPEFLAQLVGQYTRESDPFVSAPREWSAEAKKP